MAGISWGRRALPTMPTTAHCASSFRTVPRRRRRECLLLCRPRRTPPQQCTRRCCPRKPPHSCQRSHQRHSRQHSHQRGVLRPRQRSHQRGLLVAAQATRTHRRQHRSCITTGPAPCHFAPTPVATTTTRLQPQTTAASSLSKAATRSPAVCGSSLRRSATRRRSTTNRPPTARASIAGTSFASRRAASPTLGSGRSAPSRISTHVRWPPAFRVVDASFAIGGHALAPHTARQPRPRSARMAGTGCTGTCTAGTCASGPASLRDCGPSETVQLFGTTQAPTALAAGTPPLRCNCERCRCCLRRVRPSWLRSILGDLIRWRGKVKMLRPASE